MSVPFYEATIDYAAALQRKKEYSKQVSAALLCRSQSADAAGSWL